MKKPYRVIIRSQNKMTIQKAVKKLVKESQGKGDLRIGRIHRG